MKPLTNTPSLTAQRGAVLLLISLVVAALLMMAREWVWTSAPLRKIEWRMEDNCHLSGRLTATDPEIQPEPGERLPRRCAGLPPPAVDPERLDLAA